MTQRELMRSRDESSPSDQDEYLPVSQDLINMEWPSDFLMQPTYDAVRRHALNPHLRNLMLFHCIAGEEHSRTSWLCCADLLCCPSEGDAICEAADAGCSNISFDNHCRFRSFF